MTAAVVCLSVSVLLLLLMLIGSFRALATWRDAYLKVNGELLKVAAELAKDSRR